MEFKLCRTEVLTTAPKNSPSSDGVFPNSSGSTKAPCSSSSHSLLQQDDTCHITEKKVENSGLMQGQVAGTAS